MEMEGYNKTHRRALAAEQVRQYETEGFLVLPEHLDRQTVAALVRGTEELAGRVRPIQPGTPRIQVDLIDGEYRLRMIEPVVDLCETFAHLEHMVLSGSVVRHREHGRLIYRAAA